MEQSVRMNQDLYEALSAMGNRLRIHSIVSTSEAGSGHPTSCMSAADVTAAIFFHAMRYDVANPRNPVNDRIVFSKGHAAPLLYAAWAEAGAFPVERLKTLRQLDSDLEGHPTPRLPWVEVATGSLGQGLSCGVGMALNSKELDKIDNRVFVVMGDGEVAEGSIWEAAAMASYHKLGNIVGVVDVNALGQSQRTMYNHDGEVYRSRFEAFGWHAVTIDGHDLRQIVLALDEAMKTTDKPSVLIALTKKGKGVSFIEDKDGWHGKPLKKGEEMERALAELTGKTAAAEGLKVAPPQGRSAPPSGSSSAQPETPSYNSGDQVATREAYGTGLARLGDVNPLVVALDGDTKNSTFSEKFLKKHPDRFFESFIAEQNMVGAAVGLGSMGKIPFASTFACFLTRAYDQIRMAAISRANLKLCGSHAGVSIGEDGPSQMALEDLAMMRAIEGSTVLYPSDAVAAEQAVSLAAEHQGIVYIRTSRPKTAVIYANDEKFQIGRCKVVRRSEDDRATIVAGGVTLFEALAAYEELKAEGTFIRIIDIFSVKPVDEQLLRSAGRETNIIITVEDHSVSGGIGDAVAGAVAPSGVRVYQLGVREMPRSGKPEELMAACGIDRASIVKTVRSLLTGTNGH